MCRIHRGGFDDAAATQYKLWQLLDEAVVAGTTWQGVQAARQILMWLSGRKMLGTGVMSRCRKQRGVGCFQIHADIITLGGIGTLLVEAAGTTKQHHGLAVAIPFT